MKIRLLDTGLLSGAENMALDGIILEEVEAGNSPPTFRFLRFDPPVALVGYNQDISQEIREEYCAGEGIEINRRHTGGGAILFEASMLGFELFWPVDLPGLPSGFVQITELLGGLGAEALTRLGVPAQFRPRNDIEVRGRKISGTGMSFLSRAWMFQGTVLVDNCLDRMLRALRVPLEKLKRREIQSLLQRITFLSEELDPAPGMERIKAAFKEAFSEGLELELEPAPLTGRERERLNRELPFYRSPEWVHRRRVEGRAQDVLRARSGRLQVTLMADLKNRRIKEAVITGDFFTRPKRLLMDLEAALRGVPLKPQTIAKVLEEFLGSKERAFEGTDPGEIIRTVAEAAEKGSSPWPDFRVEELNLIHPLCQKMDLEGWSRPEWLLLPYCAKDMGCVIRYRDECYECGLCDIGDMYKLAFKKGLNPVTITSFEHLMDVLKWLSLEHPGETYVASCCQAFLAKHQHEMEASGVPGIIVGLDSLTCYDLGKEQNAYRGDYEKQSRLETELMAKVLDFLAGPDREAG